LVIRRKRDPSPWKGFIQPQTEIQDTPMQNMDIWKSSLETLVFVINEVVHTMNNSIGIAKGNLSFIRESNCSPEQIEMIGDIQVTLERLVGLSNRLQHYSVYKTFEAIELDLKEFLTGIVDTASLGVIKLSIEENASEQGGHIAIADGDYLQSAIDLLLFEVVSLRPEVNHIQIGLSRLVEKSSKQSAIQKNRDYLEMRFSDQRGAINYLEHYEPLKIGMGSNHRIADPSISLAFISHVVRACDGDVYFESSANSADKVMCIALPCAPRS